MNSMKNAENFTDLMGKNVKDITLLSVISLL